MILGNMGDEFDFSETVIDLWLANEEANWTLGKEAIKSAKILI
jgi:hypothetical protein